MLPRKSAFRLLLQVLLGTTLFCAFNSALRAAEVNVGLTNWVERWITNLIDVRMPTNVFINVYRTNWVEQKQTNFVPAYKTNLVQVNQFRTNIVPAYATNLTKITRTNHVPVQAWLTNLVTAYQTNWKSLRLTNEIPVEQTQTNFFTRYQTNWKTLNLTNWETVLVMKTNWVIQHVTNVVQIDLTTNRFFATEVGATKPGSEPKLASVPASVSLPPANSSGAGVPPAKLSEDLLLEAATTGRFSTNNQPEVQLQVRWLPDASVILQIQQWRVEREGGSVLCFGQEPIFRRALPTGKYRIEVKAQRDSKGPLLCARGTLDLKPREAVIQPLVVRR